MASKSLFLHLWFKDNKFGVKRGLSNAAGWGGVTFTLNFMFDFFFQPAAKKTTGGKKPAKAAASFKDDEVMKEQEMTVTYLKPGTGCS